MSLWGAASTLGGATGVAAGGCWPARSGWSSVFLVTLPVSLVAVVAAGASSTTASPARAMFRRPRSRDHHRGGRGARPRGAQPRVRELAGFVILGVAVPVALAAVFIRAERHASEPFVPFDLFSSPIA